ncbi:hypothetical protein Slala04_68600 [Streptomyces lavendulae subsp. lavendulae]|nr:hypothetical protein Slala04_68600 [Streptomyces lavendulae subsp. lavendulae]
MPGLQRGFPNTTPMLSLRRRAPSVQHPLLIRGPVSREIPFDTTSSSGTPVTGSRPWRRGRRPTREAPLALRPPVEPMLAQAAEAVSGREALRAGVAYEQRL